MVRSEVESILGQEHVAIGAARYRCVKAKIDWSERLSEVLYMYVCRYA